ncbi:MAG TPA: hypothetical protein G4O14_13045 [Anaerolineae bacterium]|nr:hypothetical protein [Anaerolineae bacterium]
MSQSLAHIQCPNCKSGIQAAIEQLVDVGHDPSAKSRLLSGTFNRISCPVCGFEGQMSTPLVYHDPNNELLLTYIPVELNIPKEEQERVIGQLINQAVQDLPAESRKGYLFQPQPVLTMQSLMERILEADGISREEIEAQRAKMRLFEDLVRIPEENLPAFINDHDGEMDAAFFQLASLTLQATNDRRAHEALNQRLGTALELTTYGKELAAQEAELRAAAESLKEAGEELDRKAILELLVEAPNDRRILALVNLTRPALDYSFFQELTERIDSAEGDEAERLIALRSRILEITQQIDQVQEARAAQATSLLRSLLVTENLDQALQTALPLIDNLFLSILEANIQAAKEADDQATLTKLKTIHENIEQWIKDSIPPGLLLAQEILEIQDEDQAIALLDESAQKIDEQLLGSLIAAAERFEDDEAEEDAQRVRKLYRQAIRLSMREKMKAENSKQ